MNDKKHPMTKARIAQCVNACSEFDNPMQDVFALKFQRDKLLEALKPLVHYGPTANPDMIKARAAIAEAEGSEG